MSTDLLLLDADVEVVELLELLDFVPPENCPMITRISNIPRITFQLSSLFLLGAASSGLVIVAGYALIF